MAIPIIGPLLRLGGSVVDGVNEHYEGKRRLKKAIVDNNIRLAQSEQTHNQSWEMRSLENAGWKDEVLFYSFIAMFVWAGFDPDGAKQFFENLSILPEWFVKTWLWIIASILGVKKIGDYAPSLIKGVKEALKRGDDSVS